MSKSNRRNFNRGGANKANQPNKNKEYEILVHGINSDGAGVGRLPDGKTVFVDGTLPDEFIRVLVIKENKSYCVGKLVEVLEPSVGRCVPFCDVASKCGGCTFQHANYDEQLKMKYDVVFSALQRLGGVDENGLCSVMSDVLGMSEPFRYRNKVQYPVGEGGIGFYAKHSHRIIEHDECLIQPEICEEIRCAVEEYIKVSGCSIYNEKTGEGLLRHLMVRVGTKTDELMVVLVINGGVSALHNVEGLIDSLRSVAGERLKSVFANINTANSNVIMGDECLKLFGEDCITEMIGDKVFKISPLSFFQVNTDQCKVLYDVVRDFAVRALTGAAARDDVGFGGKRTIVDLYCGAGTIGIYLSDLADRIVGVEVVEPAVRNAEENARLNGVENAIYICGEAESVLGGDFDGEFDGDFDSEFGDKRSGTISDNVSDVLKDVLQNKVDVLVVDPPRKGCDEQVLKAINESVAQNIIYVSCNPATLARDIKRLGEMSDNGWYLEAVQPVDMFPWTGHVETVCMLARK